MIDENLIVKPRCIRCSGYEHEYLRAVLQKYREKVKTKKNADMGIPDMSEEPSIQQPKQNDKPIQRVGISVQDFLKQQGVVSPAEQMPATNTEESEVDYSEWNTDPMMRELDRGCCYETDGFGYPDDADRFSRKYPAIWQKLYNAKKNNKTAIYNEIMYTEVWEIVKNGRF